MGAVNEKGQLICLLLCVDVVKEEKKVLELWGARVQNPEKSIDFFPVLQAIKLEKKTSNQIKCYVQGLWDGYFAWCWHLKSNPIFSEWNFKETAKKHRSDASFKQWTYDYITANSTVAYFIFNCLFCMLSIVVIWPGKDTSIVHFNGQNI